MARRGTGGKKERQAGKSGKKRPKGGGWLWGWAVSMDPARRARIAGATARVATVCILIVLVAVGLRRLERYVQQLPRFRGRQVTLTLADKPAWMDQALAEQILEDAIGPIRSRLSRLRSQGQGYQMVELVAKQLDRSAWVEQVVNVSQCFAGQLVARCRFRKPEVMVARDGRYHLIDQKGVVLPGKYRREDLAASGLLEVKGVHGKMPACGRRWTNMALQAALDLTRMFEQQAFRSQIRVIDVTNYGGSVDPLASWIVLLTDIGATIQWGRPPGQEMGLENSAAQKLALLAGVYRQYGRVDMNRRMIDIRRNPTEVDVAIASGGLSHASR